MENPAGNILGRLLLCFPRALRPIHLYSEPTMGPLTGIQRLLEVSIPCIPGSPRPESLLSVSCPTGGSWQGRPTEVRVCVTGGRPVEVKVLQGCLDAAEGSPGSSRLTRCPAWEVGRVVGPL